MENRESLTNADRILREYLSTLKPVGGKAEYQRVFLARSDPALNYGSLAAVLLNKICLQRLHALERETSIDILPILGVGSAPFRGNLKPTKPQNCLKGYPSVQTFTLQSSFKYDYPESVVRAGVQAINETKRAPPVAVDETKANAIIDKLVKQYQKEIAVLVPLISTLARHNPARRSRKMHIGLFGYSRNLKGVSLPRAIPFCAALYSIGVPPELLGLSALNAKDLDVVRSMYVAFDEDITDSTRYVCLKNLPRLPGGVGANVLQTLESFDCQPDEDYSAACEEVLDIALSDTPTQLTDAMMKTAWKRNFLG